jgi:single-strand DNA-binding protein
MALFDDINEVRLLGNITNEPDLKFTPSGTAVLSFSVATNRRYQKENEWVDEPAFHNIVVWGQRAQSLAQRISKGTRVHVAGRLQTRSWEGTDGKKNYKTEIISDNVILIARYKEGPSSELQPAKASSGKAGASNNEPSFSEDSVATEPSIDPDDLPF